MELLPIPAGTPSVPIETMKAWAQKHDPGLWERAIAGLPRFRNNPATVRAMILEDEPLDARAAEDDILVIR